MQSPVASCQIFGGLSLTSTLTWLWALEPSKSWHRQHSCNESNRDRQFM